MKWVYDELMYENALTGYDSIKDFIMEGDARISFPEGRMRMENNRDPGEGQKANFVYWCPVDFPSNIAVEWDFWPIREPGLCIIFFAATGKNGEDLFDQRLNKRTGEYEQYHHGDINALHVSYYRRRYPSERAFHTCNLRKSYGFHMVCQGADPLPPVADAVPPYRIKLVTLGNKVWFYINELQIFYWQDDGKKYGHVLAGGKIGFRQMAPLIGDYSCLKVYSIKRSS